MNHKELKAIKRRCEKATDGPWRIAAPYLYFRVVAMNDYIADMDARSGKSKQTDDAEFIAHARTDVPALVEEVERLQAELATSRMETHDARVRGKEIILL